MTSKRCSTGVMYVIRQSWRSPEAQGQGAMGGNKQGTPGNERVEKSGEGA